ncbi:MAG: hypothetical protein RIR26_873 [Pseudomonadota bacterium]
MRAEFQKPKFAKKALWLLLTLCAATLLVIRQKKFTQLNAMSLSAPGRKYAPQTELKPEWIGNLLVQSELSPVSSTKESVPEPPLPSGHFIPPESESLGFAQSRFLVDSKWATIRFLGENPAGAGLTGEALNQAQMAALGSDRDSIPVVTAAQTINSMMDDFFVPLLSELPRGEDILSRIKVQGVYLSPRYKDPDGNPTDRDNAFVVGLQSLFLYPNSCFDSTQAATCSPLGFSAGHDPTIIAHELSHVIFNQIRDARSLEGWQWFAVNEGYADYFSAAYFGDPVLGRIWRVSRASGARYLRRLLDTPTTNDTQALEEGHAFGVVWSSTLWRSRLRLSQTFSVPASEFDRVVLMSINFLGESTKSRLGDAAAAVLKAADVFGHSEWKPLLIEEFKKAEVDLREGQKITTPQGEAIPQAQGGIVCGSLSSSIRNENRPAHLPILFLLLVPLFLSFGLRWLRLLFRAGLFLFLMVLMQACQLSGLWSKSPSPSSGVALLYNCNMSALKDGTPTFPKQRKLTLTFLNGTEQNSQFEQIFVGDERFENGTSSLLLIVDKSTMRIDQFRRRDGSLFQINLNQKFVSSEEALAVQNMRLGTILIEGVGRAFRVQSISQPTEPKATTPSAVHFQSTGINLRADIKPDLVGARGFGPLANLVQVDEEILCSLQSRNP